MHSSTRDHRIGAKVGGLSSSTLRLFMKISWIAQRGYVPCVYFRAMAAWKLLQTTWSTLHADTIHRRRAGATRPGPGPQYLQQHVRDELYR